jgi:hypothetical protein
MAASSGPARPGGVTCGALRSESAARIVSAKKELFMRNAKLRRTTLRLDAKVLKTVEQLAQDTCMSDDPAPDYYLRYVQRLLMQGLSAALPYDPDEPSNVHSIEAARTRRATAQMMRGRVPRERPL